MEQQHSDYELVARCQKGEKEAFDILMERYEKKVFNTVLLLVHNYEEAVDIVQQAFVKSYTSIGRLGNEKNFQAWVFKIALNLAKNKLKQKKVQKSVSIHEKHGETTDIRT